MQPPPSFVERLRWAFSLRRTWGTLFATTPERLRPLDGLRAFSVAWVIAFHAGGHTVGSVPLSTYFGLLAAKWMLPIWRGAFGVDVFFVISGFLIAGMLVDEKERRGRIDLARFYLRRLLRLWPAMAIAVAIDTAFTCGHPGQAWSNLLYVNNFLPVTQVCASWTWSLAIEEQFYLVCPWLLLALLPLALRFRMGALAAALAALVAVAAKVVVSGDFHAFNAEIVITRPLVFWFRDFDALYSKPWMRAGPLLAGVGAALLYRSPPFMRALAGSGWRGNVAMAIAACAAITATHWPLVEHAGRALEVAFLASFRTAFGLGVAALLLFALSEHATGRALGRVLSARALVPLAQLAYAAYLVNPIVVAVVHKALVPVFADGTVAPMPILLPVDFALTFAAALVLYLAVERPLMDLRPRA